MKSTNLYTSGFIIRYPEGDYSQERRVNIYNNDIKETHLVVDGDTLTGIAFQYYNKPFLWFAIADANNLINPFLLETGSILIIPHIKNLL